LSSQEAENSGLKKEEAGRARNPERKKLTISHHNGEDEQVLSQKKGTFPMEFKVRGGLSIKSHQGLKNKNSNY